MKRNFTSFLLIVLSLATFYQAKAQINIANGLVAYYPFTGNANDVSGNGLNGSVNGASLTTDRFGNSNSAYEFDGSNGYISISYNSLLNLTGDKSVSLWYYLPSSVVNTSATLFHIKNASNTWYPTVQISHLDHYTYGTGQYKNSFFFGKSTSNYQINTKQLYTNYLKQWVHIVGTYSQSSGYSKIYFNGVISDSLYVGNITSNSSNSDIHIGRQDSDKDTYYKGYLDDVRIYNRELTADEIAYLYTESPVNFDRVSSVATCNYNDSIKVNYTKQITLNSNNTIEFQLSDSNGNFTNYYTLKTNSNNVKGSDSIYLRIPSNIPASDLYRLRVTTTSPTSEIVWSKKIQIFPKPKPDFIVQNDSQCLIGNTYSFVNQSSIKNGFIINTWYFGDNTSDYTTSPIKKYSKSGAYIVKLLAESDKGCKDSISKTITIKENPKAMFFINNPEQCFRDNSFKVANQSTISVGSIQSLWSFGDGDTSTKKNPEHSYGFKGNYNVFLKATSDNGCSDTSSKIVSVNEQPKASFVVAEKNQCIKNHQFNFLNTSVYNGANLGFQWDFGDQSNDTAKNPMKKYMDTGIFMVRQVVTSEKNCMDTFEQTVRVFANPGSFMTEIKNDVCIGDSVVFQIKNINSSYQYKWLKNDTFNGDINENYYVTKPGKIMLITTNSNKCSDTSIGVYAVFKALPIQPIITRIDRILNAGPGYADYQWYLNNQKLNGEKGQTVEISLNGNYKVRVENADGCATESNNVSVANAGISKAFQNQVLVYPNPSNGDVKIDCQIDSKIEVYDIQGRLVQAISIYDTHHELSMGNMEPGMYLIKIISRNELISNLKISLTR